MHKLLAAPNLPPRISSRCLPSAPPVPMTNPDRTFTLRYRNTKSDCKAAGCLSAGDVSDEIRSSCATDGNSNTEVRGSILYVTDNHSMRGRVRIWSNFRD